MGMKLLIKYTAFLLLFVLSGTIGAAEDKILFAHKWNLLILNNQPIILEKFVNQKPFVEFNEKHFFAANVGCNQIRGAITITPPDTLTFAENMTSTKMACPKYFMDLENEFTATLQKVKYWRIKEDKILELLNSDKEVVIILTNVTIY